MRHTNRVVLAFVIALSTMFIHACHTAFVPDNIILSQKADSFLRDTAPVNYVVDSLRKKFYSPLPDTERIDVLNELSQQYRVAARVLSEDAYAQSVKLGYQYGMADALCRRGIVYYRYADYDSARWCYDRSAAIAEKIHSDKLLAQALAWKGDAFRMEGNSDTALDYLQRAKAIADECGAKTITGFCLSGMGSMYYISGEYDKSIDYTSRALLVAAETNDKFRMGFCLSSLGKVYDMQGRYAESIATFSQAMELAKEVQNKTLISFCLNSIGDIYRQEDDTAQARTYFLQALDMGREIGDKGRTAYALSYLGDIAREEQKPLLAIDYYRQSIPIATEGDDMGSVVYSYNGIGDSYRMLDQYDSALLYFHRSLSLCDSVNDQEEIANNMISIAKSDYERGDVRAAEPWALKGYEVSRHVGIPEYERDAAEMLYLIYKATGRPAQALEMHEFCVRMNDSIVNVTNVKRFEEEQYKAKENEMKSDQAKKDALTQQEKLQHERDLEKQTYISYSASGGGVLVLICLVIAIRGYRNKRKANEAIQQQKEKVEQQKSIIEEKNKEIVDSINYAQRIQTAIFPAEQKVKDVFGECFILYLPKDIVSGDFYWMEKARDGSALLAAVDCTGHGVPGALVSVVGNNALNRTVREFGLTDPGKILDKLNDLVEETFAQSESDVKDGMDISLLSISESNGGKVLKWAGANNNLWYIRNGALNELKADRQPIGKHENHAAFNTHTLPLQQGDSIYIFTDGYADQFGGPKGKKFKYKNLQDLVLEIHQLPSQQQKERLLRVFNEWKSDLEQIDDVLIIGLRIS